MFYKSLLVRSRAGVEVFLAGVHLLGGSDAPPSGRVLSHSDACSRAFSLKNTAFEYRGGFELGGYSWQHRFWLKNWEIFTISFLALTYSLWGLDLEPLDLNGAWSLREPCYRSSCTTFYWITLSEDRMLWVEIRSDDSASFKSWPCKLPGRCLPEEVGRWSLPDECGRSRDFLTGFGPAKLPKSP